MTAAALVVCLTVALGAAEGWAQDQNRPTIQNRFATKSGTFYGHAMMTTQIRNDFYDSIGVGADIGYYPSEVLGIEGRWAYLFSALSPAAQDVKSETGLTPDARPQHMWMTAGIRHSFGYGKMLVAGNSVVHFDPQLTMHGGLALAEKRVLPTATAGASLLAHFLDGVQAKLDLAMAMQLERRNRGWVPSFGFTPTIAIGWGGHFEDLVEMVAPKGGGSE